MLRNLALACLGLSLLAGPAAARGDGSTGSGRKAEAKAFRSAKSERSPLLLRRAMVVPVRPTGLLSNAACGRPVRGGVARCGGAGLRTVHWGGAWTHGLPPALGVQAQECPSGTMATLAEGHDDIVRCIPV